MSWLTTVQLPIWTRHQNCAKGTFRFYPSKKVDVIGSFGQETFIRRHEYIDVGVEIPKVNFSRCVITKYIIHIE